MKPEQQELWQRIEAYPLDAADAPLPFSAKLARENRWTQAFARRVALEYKRFAFLFVAAGHPVSPSDTVDQAWHLHINYTRDYWKKFCRDVLGRPLHHQPGDGSANEREKFHDWYAQTLASYRAIFGTEPPADIWPSVAARKAARENFVRIDTQAHWVIRKPTWQDIAPFAAATTAVVALLFGCGAGMEDGLNPFEWRGPDFLKFFLGLAVVLFALAAWLRHSLRRPVDTDWQLHEHLDPYAIAMLNGGAVNTVQAGVASLMARRMLVPNAANSFLSMGELPPQSPLLERALFSAARAKTGADYAQFLNAARPALGQIAEDLKARGLFMPDHDAWRCRVVPVVLAALVPLAGLIKIAVGFSRGRPVSFLVVLTVLSVVLLVWLFARKTERSRAGDAILAKFRQRYARLQNHLPSDTPDAMTAATAVGLFGLLALNHTWMSGLNQQLMPPPRHRLSQDYGSSCSTSSCGTGSSCGGGGGGGGDGGGSGCGGCGGGGH